MLTVIGPSTRRGYKEQGFSAETRRHILNHRAKDLRPEGLGLLRRMRSVEYRNCRLCIYRALDHTSAILVTWRFQNRCSYQQPFISIRDTKESSSVLQPILCTIYKLSSVLSRFVVSFFPVVASFVCVWAQCSGKGVFVTVLIPNKGPWRPCASGWGSRRCSSPQATRLNKTTVANVIDENKTERIYKINRLTARNDGQG